MEIIEHAGGTAVFGLGGKGIIDIAIGVSLLDFEKVRSQVEALGYLYRESGSTVERLFFRIDFPDSDEGMRRYHLHLTNRESKEWEDFIKFRDLPKIEPRSS